MSTTTIVIIYVVLLVTATVLLIRARIAETSPTRRKDVDIMAMEASIDLASLLIKSVETEDFDRCVDLSKARKLVEEARALVPLGDNEKTYQKTREAFLAALDAAKELEAKHPKEDRDKALKAEDPKADPDKAQ